MDESPHTCPGRLPSRHQIYHARAVSIVFEPFPTCFWCFEVYTSRPSNVVLRCWSSSRSWAPLVLHDPSTQTWHIPGHLVPTSWTRPQITHSQFLEFTCACDTARWWSRTCWEFNLWNHQQSLISLLSRRLSSRNGGIWNVEELSPRLQSTAVVLYDSIY